jgi:hypothetical protein
MKKMKYPCLVSTGVVSIAIDDSQFIPLEGGAKGSVCKLQGNYSAVTMSCDIYHKECDTDFINQARRNNYEFFNILQFVGRRDFNTGDLDLKFIADTFNSGEPVTPVIGQRVSIALKNNANSTASGKLKYISEHYIILENVNCGECHYHRKSWELINSEREKMRQILRDHWFENGQDINTFIDIVVSEYGSDK